MQTIDYSEIKDLKFCPQLHYFKHILDYEPNKPDVRMVLGSAVHAALDAHNRQQEHYLYAYAASFAQQRREIEKHYTLSERESEELDTQLFLGQGMLAHYFSHYADKEEPTYLVSEYDFLVPIPNTDGAFKGRVDGIIKDRCGEYWIAEHKTAASFPQPAFFALDEQTLKYQWAMQELISAGLIPEVPSDVILAGYWYNGLLKKVPDVPELVEKGKRLSKAKRTTTYDVYAQAILENGFQLEDYQGKLDELQAQDNPFFLRYYQHRTPYELRNVAWRLEMEYKERFRENRPVLPKTPDKYCIDCPFYWPCLATQQGGDVKDLLTTLFHKRVHKKERGNV